MIRDTNKFSKNKSQFAEISQTNVLRNVRQYEQRTVKDNNKQDFWAGTESKIYWPTIKKRIEEKIISMGLEKWILNIEGEREADRIIESRPSKSAVEIKAQEYYDQMADQFKSKLDILKLKIERTEEPSTKHQLEMEWELEKINCKTELIKIKHEYSDKLDSDFRQQRDSYEKKRKICEDKRNKAHEVFISCFGVNARTIVQQELEEQRYYAAWKKLNKEFSLTNQDDIYTAHKMLENLSWNPKFQSFLELTTQIESLCKCISPEEGSKEFEAYCKRRLIDTLLNSDVADQFQQELEFTQQARESYQDFKIRIQVKLNEIRSNSAIENLNQTNQSYGLRFLKVKDSRVKKCHFCQSPDHLIAQCPDYKKQQQPNVQKKEYNQVKDAKSKREKHMCIYCHKWGTHTPEDCRSNPKNNQSKMDKGNDHDTKDQDNNDRMKKIFEKRIIQKQGNGSPDPKKVRFSMIKKTYNGQRGQLKRRRTKYTLILDSGASNHLIPFSEIFDTFEECDENVLLGDKVTRIRATGIGNVGFLQDVYYVPDLEEGVISIGALDNEGYHINTSNGIMECYDQEGNLVMEGVREDDNLYYIYTDNLRDTFSGTTNKLMRISTDQDLPKQKLNKSYAKIYYGDPLKHLHHRYGHLNIPAIKRAIRERTICGHGISDYDNIKDNNGFICVDCLKGKMKSFHMTESTTDHSTRENFELVATDDKGPFKIKSVNGYSRFDLFIFDGSHWIEVMFKKNKNDFLDNFKIVVNNVELLYNGRIKILQSDNENIYNDHEVIEYLQEKKIVQQQSTPYKKQMNGFIERCMGNVLETATVIMSVYNTPLRFWDYAIEAAVYMKNRQPTSFLNGKTPYEMVTGKIPDISNMVPFYAPGLVLVHKDERESGQLVHKAKECRMLGYADDLGMKNSYIVWVPEDRRIIARHDCIFDERLVPESEQDVELLGNYQQLATVQNDLSPKINDDIEFLKGELDNQDEDLYDDGKTDSEFSDMDENDIQLNLMRTNITKPVYGLKNWRLFQDIINESENKTTSVTIDGDNGKINLRVLQLLESDHITLPRIPKNWNEAMNSENAEQWLKAGKDEVNQLFDRDTFKIDNSGTHGSRSKFVFSATFDNEMNIKFKVRLVMCGYSQKKGRDYDQTFAPTLNYSTMLIVLKIALNKNWKIIIMDIGNAFVEGKNDLDVYMFLPEEFNNENGTRTRVKVINSLYGEKQAAFIWYQTLAKFLIMDLRFTRLVNDSCTFIKKNSREEIEIIVCIHVDDISVYSSNSEIQNQFIEDMKKKWKKVKVLEDFSKYLGICIERKQGEIQLHQKEYIKQLAQNMFDQGQSISTSTIPIKPNWKKSQNNSQTEEQIDFQSMIGKYRFLVDRTRPDCQVAVGIMAQHKITNNPQIIDCHINFMQYLMSTWDLTPTIKCSYEEKTIQKVSVMNWSEYPTVRRDPANNWQQNRMKEEEILNGEPVMDWKLHDSSTNERNKEILNGELGLAKQINDSSNDEIAQRLEQEIDESKDNKLSKDMIETIDSHGNICEIHETDPKGLYDLQCENYELHPELKRIRFSGKDTTNIESMVIYAFCDASYNLEDYGTSRLGGCIYTGFDSMAIHWYSHKDTTISHSSTEAELKSICYMIKELLFIKNLMDELGYEQEGPCILFVDNRSAIELCNSLKTKSQTKHINVKIAYIREKINSREIEIRFVPSELNIADILTKPLSTKLFEQHRQMLLKGVSKEFYEKLKGNSRVKIHNKIGLKLGMMIEESLTNPN
jgi:hypothetical protein